MKKTAYVFSFSGRPSGEPLVEGSFVSDDLRKGLDEAMRRFDGISPGLAKAIGQGCRVLLEGGKELKTGVPHSVSGTTEGARGGLTVLGHEML